MTDKPDDKAKKQREMMDKIYAMTPEEFSQFMAWNFQRLCKKPLPSTERTEP